MLTSDACVFCIFVLSVLTIAFVRKICMNAGDKLILNIYGVNGSFYWLKLVCAWILIQINFNKSKVNHHRSFQLSDNEKAVQGIYFNGSSASGDHLIVGSAKRGSGITDTFMCLKLADSGLGILTLPISPNTTCSSTNGSYNTHGIELSKRSNYWDLTYTGDLRDGKDTVNIKLDMTWTPISPSFNFNSDICVSEMAKAMAAEKWSKCYFQTLKSIHQTHFEQYGQAKLKVSLRNKEFDIQLDCMRDQTLGFHREWRLFHRYCLHFFYTKTEAFSVEIIAMPMAFSRLVVGHVYSSINKRQVPIKNCSLQLYQHGEDGVPPTNYAFRFEAGEKSYLVDVACTDDTYIEISMEKDCKIFELLCDFRVNGESGWGATEWQYRNVIPKTVKL